MMKYHLVYSLEDDEIDRFGCFYTDSLSSKDDKIDISFMTLDSFDNIEKVYPGSKECTALKRQLYGWYNEIFGTRKKPDGTKKLNDTENADGFTENSAKSGVLCINCFKAHNFEYFKNAEFLFRNLANFYESAEKKPANLDQYSGNLIYYFSPYPYLH